MKVYLAGQYAKRDLLKGYADRLQEIGVFITSRWLMEDKPLDTKIGDDTEEFYRTTAKIDLEDIDEADAIIFFSEDPHVGIPRGGRHVEFGYALAKDKTIFTIGFRENIFHFLPKINNFKTFEDCYNYLEIYYGTYIGR